MRDEGLKLQEEVSSVIACFCHSGTAYGHSEQIWQLCCLGSKPLSFYS